MEIGHSLRSLQSMPRIVLGGVPKERAGDGRLLYRRLGIQLGKEIRLVSDAFEEGEPIPITYSADGGNTQPPLSWSGLPAGVETLALIVEDPDAPTPNPFVHWLLVNIPIDGLPSEAIRHAKVGRNSMMTAAWTGCAPPKGDIDHRYVFQLFAVDRRLELGDHPGRTELIGALRGHVIGLGTLIGTYKR